MRKNIVLSLTGPDRVGIVDLVTETLTKFEGNVETSRMARLGGEFAMLMLVSMPEDQLEIFSDGVASLQQAGFQVSTKLTEQSYQQKYAGWLPYEIDVQGADHEGIIHKVAHYLTERGINIESMDTGVVPAPMSGTLFFSMSAVVLVPPGLPHKNWQTDLDDVADSLNVEIAVLPYKGK
jgi:glycine cleavage system transcriptional repressor